MDLRVRPDDLRGDAARALVAAHLRDMRATSPACSVHALDIDALRAPGVQVWSAWDEDRLVGIGALTTWGERQGELKSMRVADAYRGRGAGRGILRHIVAEAIGQGLTTLWLETGSSDEFAAARGLYQSEGFRPCPPFGDYRPDPNSVFFTRVLAG